MLTKVHTFSVASVMTIALLLALLFGTLLTPSAVYAKDGDIVHQGIVTAKPATGLRGTWVIGGQTFVTVARTQFDQVEGPLVVGACAKVKIRNGAVKEIDSEPARDCR